MYQSGSQAIPNAATTVTVTYPSAFAVVPDTLVPVVKNVSADAPKYIVSASVIAEDRFGFTVSLDVEINTGNYELAWLAGTAADIVDALSALSGRKLTSYGPLSSLLNATFKLPLLDLRGVPKLVLADQATFWSAIVQRAPVPTGPLSGLPDTFAIAADNEWIYITGASQWLRVPADSSASWTAQPFYVPFREAEVLLDSPVADQVTYHFTFATPFSTGAAPKIMISLVDVNGAAVVAYTYQVTARDLTGFDLTFSAPLQNSTLRVYYMARQLPA